MKIFLATCSPRAYLHTVNRQHIMKHTQTETEFTSRSPLHAAVVEQSGGWERFTEIAEDVTNHGASGGFGGWIYYTETEAFHAANQEHITALAERQAEDLGEPGAVAMVKTFRSAKDYTEGEIARALYGTPREDDEPVTNLLAWYALEEIAREYVEA